MFGLNAFFFIMFLKALLLLFRLKNMLMILFALEFIMVNLFFGFSYLSMPFDPMSLLVFLAVAAGEASVGLSLLMSILRQKGKDNMLKVSLTPLEGF